MSFGSNELRNYVYLRGLLDSFEKRALKYCSEGASPAERFERIKKIRDALSLKRDALTGVVVELPSEVSVSAGVTSVSLATATNGVELSHGVNVAAGGESIYPNCDADERCDGAACVPGNVVSGWPDISDPSSWET
jgi:hypothetical protein